MEIIRNPALLPSPPPTTETSSTGSTDAASASADFSSFLSLLTAQLRNQDPLQPLDSTEFVAQLASFSTVEQLIGTNRRLDGLAAQAESVTVASYAEWIGREASLSDGSFIGTGTPRSFAFDALPSADRALAQIRRPDGTVVANLALDPSTGGAQSWDGKDASGTPIRGPLSVEIAYFNGDDEIERRPGRIFTEIVGVTGTASGVVLDFADGGSATPFAVSTLRVPVIIDET
ncbi:MAG: flagellar hook assembly protein FlgD [Pikeienuella sp.]